MRALLAVVLLSACEGTQYLSRYSLDMRNAGVWVDYKTADLAVDDFVELMERKLFAVRSETIEAIRRNPIAVRVYLADDPVRTPCNLGDAYSGCYTASGVIDLDYGVCFFDTSFLHELFHAVIHRMKRDCDESRCDYDWDPFCDPCLNGTPTQHDVYADIWRAIEEKRDEQVEQHAEECIGR